MSERRANFVKAFLIEAGPSPWLLGAFILGLLVIGVAGNFVYALVTTPQQVAAIWWQPALAIVAGTAIAYLLYWGDQRLGRRVTLTFDEGNAPPGHPGLIWVLGPGGFDHLLVALAHHHARDGAAHCWLLMQEDSAPVRKNYTEVNRAVESLYSTLHLHPVYLPRPDVQHTYEAVRSIYEREAAEAGLSADQVIADITGGTKPMTAGMLLGVLAAGRTRLEYVESNYKNDVRVEGSEHVVWVDVNFFTGPAVPAASGPPGADAGSRSR